MDSTPLYIAVARELREIEAEMAQEEGGERVFAPVAPGAEELLSHPSDRLGHAPAPELPGALVNEDVLLGPISTICATANKISQRADHESSEFAGIVLSEASKLVHELKRLGILSPIAMDPSVHHTEDAAARKLEDSRPL